MLFFQNRYLLLHCVLNEELSNTIICILVKQEVCMVTEFLLRIMSHTTLFPERLKVLNYTLEKNTFAEETVRLFIESLEEPYKYIAEKDKKLRLPDNEDVRMLLRGIKTYEFHFYIFKDKEWNDKGNHKIKVK